MAKATRKEGMRRLILVAQKLERLPRGRFFYASWVGTDWGGAQDLSCGTTACGLGWAATIPSLQRAGLRLATIEGIGCVTLRRPTKAVRAAEDRGEFPSIAAAAHVFGISEDEASWLFLPRSLIGLSSGPLPPDAGAHRVAKHIRGFVAADGIVQGAAT